MRSSFATLGLPEQLVTDNGPSFTSEEFALFLQMNGIKHITTAPYHPGSNGLAERAVQTLKSGLKKIAEGSLANRLSRFLLNYRTTPHSTMGGTPSELMFGHQLRTHMDLMKPDIGRRVRFDQDQQKQGHDAHVRPREFAAGTRVYAKNFGRGSPWLPGLVQEAKRPVSYTVELEDGRVVHRHADHVRVRTPTDGVPPEADEPDDFFPVNISTSSSDLPVAPAGPSAGPRRSSRPCHPPDHLVFWGTN